MREIEAGSLPGRENYRWKGTEEWKSIGFRDGSPSTWPERRYMASMTVTQILTVSLDVMAICSSLPHGFIVPDVS